MPKTLDVCIKGIIADNFVKGDFFDSHTVINEIMKSDEYFSAYLNEYPKGTSVAEWHSTIAKAIRDSGLVEDAGCDVKTQTIFGTVRPNRLWKKL